MGAILDDLEPAYVRAKYIVLSPAGTDPARAFLPYDVTVSFQREALTLGLVLPLELLVVQGDDPDSFFRHVYRQTVPSLITFMPRVGGQHLVLLREIAHNKWYGSLVVDVIGEKPRRRSP